MGKPFVRVIEIRFGGDRSDDEGFLQRAKISKKIRTIEIEHIEENIGADEERADYV
jgi:hypothetical protein